MCWGSFRDIKNVLNRRVEENEKRDRKEDNRDQRNGTKEIRIKKGALARS